MLKSKVDLVKLVELMEKNDQKKLQLLNYLDQYPNRQVRNSELQDKLQISYYMFKRWTKEIVDDIATFQLDDRFSLEVTDASTILHEHQYLGLFGALSETVTKSQYPADADDPTSHV